LKNFVLAAAAAVILTGGSAANADTIINGVSYFDPTSFHVTSGVATGSDPVLLNTLSAFTIQDNGGQNINTPLTVYIAAPTGAPAPIISSASYLFDSQPAVPVTVTGGGALAGSFSTAGTSDLYTFVGCVACDNSLNAGNITTAYNANGIPTPNSLTVYAFNVATGFQGKDEVNFTGTFAAGDIAFPFAQNVDTKNNNVTIFDTSWTNTGLFDGPPGPPPPPPPPPPVPEPASLAIFGTALVGMAGIKRLRRFRKG